MHWQKHNRSDARRAEQREKLEGAYWHAIEAQHRGTPANRRRWRDLAEKAKRELALLGRFV